MLRLALTSALLCACSGGCGGSAASTESTGGPTRLDPGLGEETEEGSGGGPRRIEEEAVDPPPVEPPPP